MDPTEKLAEELEKRLAKEYRQAKRELGKKLKKHLSEFKEKDAWYKKQVKDGKIEEEVYESWREDQLQRTMWIRNMRNTIAQDLYSVNNITNEMINRYNVYSFCESANYQKYHLERDVTGFDRSFHLYNKNTLSTLLKGNSNIAPRVLNEDKDKRWNMQKINSALIQSTLQGDSVQDIAKRLERVADMNETQSVRAARTMMHSASNAGKQEAINRAIEAGIKVEKGWLATLDMRTRHSHRHMDMEWVAGNETFSNGMMFPGDWDANIPNLEAEVYNCRCTLIMRVPGVLRDDSNRPSKLGEMTYDEWKTAHVKLSQEGSTGVNLKPDVKARGLQGRSALDEFGMKGVNPQVAPLKGKWGECGVHFASDGVIHVDSYVLNIDDARPVSYQQLSAYHEAFHYAADGKLHDYNKLGGRTWKRYEDAMAECSAHYLMKDRRGVTGVAPIYATYLVEMLPKLQQLPEYSKCKDIYDFGEIAYNQRIKNKECTWGLLHKRLSKIEIPDGYYRKHIATIENDYDRFANILSQAQPKYSESELRKMLESAVNKVKKGDTMTWKQYNAYTTIMVMLEYVK